LKIGRTNSLLTEIIIFPSDSKEKKRIVSLDFQRGIAIWLMTFFHAFEHLFDYNWVKDNPEKVLNLPKLVLGLGLIVYLFASWKSYFLFISSIVNTYSLTKKAQKGQNLKEALGKQLMTGIAILLVGVLNDSFFGYEGYFGHSLRTGEWNNTYYLWNGFFAMKTLQIIGWSIIITSLLHYFLMKNKGYREQTRNIIIYIVLSIVIIFLSPFIHQWVDNMTWAIPDSIPPDVGLGDHTTWPSLYFQAYNKSFKAFVCTFLAGDMEPIFPYLATSFVGAVIGTSLAQEKPTKKIPIAGGIASVLITAFGGLFIAMGFITLGNTRPSLGNYFINLGTQMGVIVLFLWLVEFRGDPEKFANRSFVRHFRLWSMISLSIFCLSIIELLPRFMLSKTANFFFGSNTNFLESSLFGMNQIYIPILVALYIMIFFELLVYFWAKINFKFSFEWFVIRFTGISNNKISKRLDVDYILNYVNWISYNRSKINNKITILSPKDQILIFNKKK
jgi:hypothetical protein